MKGIEMSALTRFEKLDDMFPEMFRRFMRPVAMPSLADDLPAEIRVDVSETDKGYDVRAEVPGVKKEDIRVTIDRNVVSISAEAKREKESDSGPKGQRTLVREIYVGSANRTFSLAHEIDEKAAVAKFEDGILKLALPKKAEASSRTLQVQ
jgi:HSP20 family protein